MVVIENTEAADLSTLQDLILVLSEVMAHFPTLLNTQKGSCLCVMVHIGQTVCLIRMWGRYWRHACMLQARAQLPVTLVLGMSISVAALRHMLPVKAADLLQAKEFRLVQVHILDHGLTSCMHTRQLLAMLKQHLCAPAELNCIC